MKSKLILPLTAAFILASCKDKSRTESASPAPSASGTELNTILSAPITGEPKGIAAVRDSVKPGDEITLTGKIMGNASPFVTGRAAFILGDPTLLTPCNQNPDDACETPWDVCCDSPEDKKRGTATIQIVDADGRVLKEPLEGIGGIAKLSAVTVTGKVAEGSSPDLLILNATALRVDK